MNLYDYLSTIETERSGNQSQEMMGRCRCGGALEKIAETNPKCEQEIMSRTIYRSCAICDEMYQTRETVYFYDSGYSIKHFSATKPYEGLLTKQEITMHAPTLRGTITAADTGMILKQRMRNNRRTR